MLESKPEVIKLSSLYKMVENLTGLSSPLRSLDHNRFRAGKKQTMTMSKS